MEYLLFAAFVVLLSPWIAATGRNHPHHGAILAFVLLLGWTGIGWALAWFWALAKEDPPHASRNAELRLVRGGLDEPEPRSPD